MSGPQSRFPRAGGGSYRDPVAHEAVLRATLALLVEVGYTKLTVEGIAERSGVPKSTIYRWWKNKAYIVYEALAIMEPPAWRAPTGNFADDLTAVLLAMLDAYTTPEAMASGPGLVADFATDAAGWERLLLGGVPLGAEALSPGDTRRRRPRSSSR